MRRREFITLLGGAAATLPLVARAQQAGGMRRIGVLLNRAADDREAEARLKAFVQGLQQLGWAEGRNAPMDVRWTAGVAPTFTGMRQNWSHSCRMSFWPMAPSA